MKPATRHQKFLLHLRLFQACVDGNVVDALGAIGAGAKIEARNIRRQTPLQKASAHGKIEICQLLLERGANIEAQDKDGRNALHEACIRGDTRTCLYLLENGADIEAPDESGRQPLKLAIGFGAQKTCMTLIAMGAKTDYLTAEEHNFALHGKTALQAVSEHDMPELVIKVLENDKHPQSLRARARDAIGYANSAQQPACESILRTWLSRGEALNALAEITELEESSGSRCDSPASSCCSATL